MAIKWGFTIRKGLGFCWRPKRWLPFFITYTTFTLLALLYIYCGTGTFLSMMVSLVSGSAAYLPAFLGFLAPLILMGIACAMINLWIKGAVIHQGWREKEFGKSWRVSCKRYPPLFTVAVFTGILAYLAGLSYIPKAIPSAGYVGVLFSFIVSAALYFPLQIVIIRGQGFWNSLVGSWQLFIDQAREKLINRKSIFLLILISEVISSPVILLSGYLTLYTAALCWIFCWFLAFAFLSLMVFSRVCDVMILTGIISLVIILMFSIPLLLVLWNILIIIQATSGLAPGAVALLGIKSLIKESILPLATSGIVFLIGASISKAFSLKAQTEFYLQMRKKVLGIF